MRINFQKVVLLFAAWSCGALILSAEADQLLTDDLLINGSLCVGAGCTDGEEFDFDTVRLKADNPLINFFDTSSSSSFPTNDWRLGIADNDNGEPAHLFIFDSGANKTVFLLQGFPSGGVAIGADSDVIPNAVSVGSEGAPRRIVNVAAGIEEHDAIIKAQFDSFKEKTEVDIASELSVFSNRLQLINQRIDALVTRIEALEE